MTTSTVLAPLVATSAASTPSPMMFIALTSAAPTPTAPTSTTLQGTVVTDAPVVRVPGPHNDGSDFYGFGLGLLAIVVAIALTRLVFRGRRETRGTGKS